MREFNSSFKFFNFGISFGVTMVASIYLGYKGGMWLDNKFSTKPVFLLIGVLLGVGVAFKSLFANLKLLEDKDKEDQK